MKQRLVLSLSSIALLMGLGVGLLLLPLIARAASGSVTHTTNADFSNLCSVLTDDIPEPSFLSTLTSTDSILLATTNFTDDFTTLNFTLWQTGTWSGTNVPLVSSGVLSVPTGTYVRSVDTFSYGVLEFSAEFGPGVDQLVGFASDNFEGNRYFVFGTDTTTDTLFARVNNNGLEQSTNLGALPSGLNLYRIEWRPGADADTDQITFFVNGSQVAQFDVDSNSATGDAQEFHIYLSNDGLLADLRVDLAGLRSGFFPGGFYISCALDTGAVGDGWQLISWDQTLPAQTGLVVETRVSSDGFTWSNWQTVTSGVLPTTGRYAQYRLDLASTNVLATPLVNSVVLTYNTIPTVSINSNVITVTEGNAGTVNAVFTATLSNPVSQTVTVDYLTANGTATSPADYTGIATSTLTFAPGVTSRPITVTVQGDVLDEDNETFFVNLSNPLNAFLANSQGQGVITNDDLPPNMTINDVTLTEGNGGTTNANFIVSLSAPSGRTITVNYATANGTATAPADYTNISGPLTFASGVITQAITVAVQGDIFDEEDNETFFVNLSGAVNVGTFDTQGQGTITDDDLPPNLSINNVSVNEGSNGATNTVFTVSLSPQSGITVTVNYATANDTATIADSDYVAATGTLTFTPGAITQAITIAVTGDGTIEPNETFFVNLSVATNANITDNQGLGTILNDDFLGVAVNQPGGSTDVTEAGTTDTYQLNLQNQPSANVVITLTTDGQITAVPTPLTFTPATWFIPQTVTVTAVNDDVYEPSPHTSVISHSVASADATYNGIAVQSVTVNITDNDGRIYLPLIIR